MDSQRLGSALAYVIVASLSAVTYAVVGLPWWFGAAAGVFGCVVHDVYREVTRKPLRADPRRIAQLEYELGFTDEKPRPPSPEYLRMAIHAKLMRDAGISFMDAHRHLRRAHDQEKNRALAKALVNARNRG